MTSRTTRLAPSPTGALHLGNARTFLVNWALARRNGWSILLRLEDLDGPRVKPGASEQTIETLRWLGLDHDGSALVQSIDLAPYRDAMRRLASRGLVFACHLTRTEIERASSAPHRDEQELRFPRHLRPTEPSRFRFEDPASNYRLLVPEGPLEVVDELAGRTLHEPEREVGDFVVWTKRSTPAYQLAVVVDDARQQVTDVVRGDDLLPSAARQLLLYRALELPPPRWWHLPLVIGPDGRRLAKRHGDTRIQWYRQAGVRPERIVGLLARWCGITATRKEMRAAEFQSALDLDRLGGCPITFDAEDHAWLLRGC